jgi:hypothetical protein
VNIGLCSTSMHGDFRSMGTVATHFSSSASVGNVPCWSFMRDAEIIETELMEISAIADDTLKFERIIAWCASHPDEVPFALHQFMGRREKHQSETSKT